MSKRNYRFDKSLVWALDKCSSNYHSSNVSIFASMVQGCLRKSCDITPERMGDIYEACQKYIEEHK